MEQREKIALTGASGYIGNNLLQKLTGYSDVIALSRNGDDRENSEHVEWRSCDLYSLDSAEKGLEGADYAVYLVHSMMPSAKLTQAKFEDMDLILADNFARAAKKNGIKQIIYMSGIIPQDTEELSRHLKSRLEVEKVLGAYGTPVTTIRAGLIVGPKGSSFPILTKLVKRLPMMLLPKWTRTKTHPIALKDVLTALKKSIGNKKLSGKSIDVGGPEVMTYEEMMIQTAEVMGRNPKVIEIPLMTVSLSRLWVSLITQSPKSTVYPLIESLKHPMVAQEENMDEEISYGQTPFKEAAKEALEEEKKEQEKEKASSSSSKRSGVSDVRSVQRILLPEGKDADWTGDHYMNWLSKLARPLLKVETNQQRVSRFKLIGFKQPIMELSYAPERSSSNRALYYITGGSFAKVIDGSRGRIEFRQIPGTQECIIAIHEYRPSLPWILYRISQAKVHIIVMYLYKRHLQHLIEKSEEHKQEGPVKKVVHIN
ncbi:NAD-dependent epimerase/dehydratase family protein [Bacillus sp. FJAT-42376]|uniref:NAD(P)H-binding protein n=1 Tax=Bacillus sp. FJAT-42376 TaxID=2014076 RepID=UPI000F513F24|nr:NAD(P)H-binding protein [Bacillus sp. FJAT-42376]AZB44730.1 NAD-dependent epimerase/dehydratase family protein [Bacillus sp. FJAT-42376]